MTLPNSEAYMCPTNNVSLSNHSSRENSLDWIAGLLIMVVIFLHIDQWAGEPWHFWDRFRAVFGFFMPWFFFKSGMFYKEIDLKDNDRRIFRTLGVPFLAFSVISWIIWLVIAFYVHGPNNVSFIFKYSIINVVNYGLLPGNGALYFLASLWGCRYLFPRLRKLVHNNYLIAVMAFAVAFACKIIDTMVIHRYLLLVVPTSFMGLAYYAMGVQWKKSQYKMPFS